MHWAGNVFEVGMGWISEWNGISIQIEAKLLKSSEGRLNFEFIAQRLHHRSI